MYKQRQNNPIETLTPHEKAPSVNHETLQNERKQNQNRITRFFYGT
jgi:hypothetical protein